MVGHQRQGDPQREQWIVENLTSKTISIGDMKTVPTLGPRKSLDLLKYASKEKIGHSENLQALIRVGWVRLSKKSAFIPEKNYTVDPNNAEGSTVEASVYEVEQGIIPGSGGAGGSINDLDDVDITGITDGQFISWDAAQGEFVPTSSSSTINDIGDITNVTLTALADTQILQYDIATTDWVNIDFTIANLTDVTTFALSNNQILQYNTGTGQWENKDLVLPTIDDIGDVDITGVSDGQVLVYNSGTGIFEPQDQTVGDINDLSNVNITGIVDGQILVWDSYTGSFLPGTQPVTENDLSNIELEGEYKVASLNAFKELLYTGANLTTINIWETSAKITLVYSKTLSYTGDQLTQTVLTRQSDSATLTKDFTYSGDNLSSIEITQA